MIGIHHSCHLCRVLTFFGASTCSFLTSAFFKSIHLLLKRNQVTCLIIYTRSFMWFTHPTRHTIGWCFAFKVITIHHLDKTNTLVTRSRYILNFLLSFIFNTFNSNMMLNRRHPFLLILQKCVWIEKKERRKGCGRKKLLMRNDCFTWPLQSLSKRSYKLTRYISYHH